jgi:chorismate lyase/3-hydroxybenzoate synthase
MIATRGVRLELSLAPVPEGDTSILGTVVFGAGRVSVCETNLEISIPLPRLGDGPFVEIWRGEEPVVRTTRDGLVMARSGDVLLGTVLAPEATDLRRRAADVYKLAISAARQEGFPHMVRMWNHFPEIHRPEAGLERYKAFCAGRAEGFEHSGFALGDDLPAASGVGTEGDGLLVVFIATSSPVSNVENPRQVSAFRYPPRYGPRSPSFARASIVEFSGERQLFVSGTASIVGCESVHVDNLELQFRETMENLRAVCEVGSEGKYRTLTDLPEPVYRAYVRHPEDYDALRSMFDEAAGPAARSVWVRGDICREELLLEIELWTRL